MMSKGMKVIRHVQQETYLFPESAFEEFSLLFIIKSKWTGNLVQIFSNSKLFPNITLFRITLTDNSLLVYNDNDDYLKFDFQFGKRNWRQFALSVKKDIVTFFSDCENIESQQFQRNLTLWEERGRIVVGDRQSQHSSDGGFNVSRNFGLHSVQCPTDLFF